MSDESDQNAQVPSELSDVELKELLEKLRTKHRHIDTEIKALIETCLLYTSPSPRDATLSRMPSSA